MGIRNKRPDLNGVLVINKPLTWTSADVCRLIRRKTGGAKVGHGGTLDPLATGVLVVCLGRATKTIDEIMGAAKRYRADIDLSAFSTTDDAEGDCTPVAPPTALPDKDQIRAALDAMTGTIMQRPPAFSAIKVDGKRAYKLARAGETVELKPRAVRIDGIEIVGYTWPTLTLDIRCGKGTYIRSIARDLGGALATGGMLAGLVRTEVGRFTLDTAVNPETLPDMFTPEDLHERIETGSD
jgi:tRNA pseudouridine55 synthase